MQTIEPHTLIKVPREVAVCPYCDGDLACRPTAWEQEDDGSWSCSETGLDCVNEPEISDDEDAYDQWMCQHTVMPYVYWMPVDLTVRDWINSQYRFKIDA